MILHGILYAVYQRVTAVRYRIPRATLRYRYKGGESVQTSHEPQARLSTLKEAYLRD